MTGEKSQINIKEYWGILLRHRSLMILPIMIVPLLAIAASYFISPSFSSTVSILTGEANILPSTVERELEGTQRVTMISTRDRQNALYSKITSTKYLRRLIAVLDIPISPAVRKLVAETKAQYPEISETELAENIMADNLRKSIVVGLHGENIIEVQVNSSNPVFAQKMARALSDIFIEESLAQELGGIKSNITFSEEQLMVYHGKLKDAEDKLRQYRENLVLSSVGEDTSASGLQLIMSASDALDIEITKFDNKQSDLRTLLIASGIDVSQLGLSGSIATEQSKLTSLISTLADLLAKYSWRDSKVLKLNDDAKLMLDNIISQMPRFVDIQYASQNADTKRNIIEYLTNSITSDYTRTKKEALDRSIGRIKSRLTSNPDTEVTIQRLQSEIDKYKELYDLFVNRSQYAAIDQSAKKVEAEAKYMIIKPASLPLTPDSPNRLRMLLMGIGLGVALGLGAIVIVEMLDSSFKKIEDVEALLGINVIGTIPKMSLPFDSFSRKRIPIFIGAGISVLLLILIIYLNFSKNG